MKINHLKRYFIGIAMTAFLALLAGNAFGSNTSYENASRDGTDGYEAGNAASHAYSNNYMVVSPYWQTEGSASYTFIAVSHSSLSGMASQIGVKMHAITSTGAAYNTAATFTVGSGKTRRVFIVPTNHSTINPTSITTNASFIAGTTNFTYGHVRVNPVTSHPMLKGGGVYTSVNSQSNGGGFRDTTMLTYWGSVIVEANTTGFAMEFIGDLHDSVAATGNRRPGWLTTPTAGHGADVQLYSTGVNLQ